MKQSTHLRHGLLVAHLMVACVLFNTSCDEPNNFVATTDTICRCDTNSPDNRCNGFGANWDYTFNNLQEVSARDFKNGDRIGTNCQGEAFIAKDWFPLEFNSWQPVDGLKHNMVATLHSFNWSAGHPLIMDLDDDWNMYVIPTSPFQTIQTDVTDLHDPGDEEHKCGDTPCMEVEISPDKQFWTNPWFYLPGVHPEDREKNGFSWLQGRQIGFYGPWIMDANHGFRPEIHPAEMMWFKDHFEGSGPPYDVFWLLFMQDNTGRFDDPNNFDCDGDPPPGWRPWADSPRSGEFSIAFEVNPQNEVASFFITEVFQRFVVTSQDSNARRDADDGKSHALEYNGRVVVRVEETQPNDDDLGVTFTNLCLGGDGKLRGFVSLRSKIGGDDDKDEEGFHVLRVTRTKAASRPDATTPPINELPVVLATSKEIGTSLRGNGDGFSGDFQITLFGNSRTTDRDYVVSKIEYEGQSGRREIEFDQKYGTKEVLLHDVPLVSHGRIIVTAASGRTMNLNSASLSPIPGIKQTVTRSVIDAAAGRFLSAVVGGMPGASLPNDKKLSALQELQLKLNPRYGPHNGEKFITDAESPFVSELNQAIAKTDSKKLEQLFNSTQPFTVAWTFEAINLTTAKPVPVYRDNNPGSDGIQIEMTSGNVANDTLKIKFGSSALAGIIELRAKGTITDTKGKTSVVEHRVWSHGFQSKSNNIAEWAGVIHALAGLKDRSLLSVRRPSKKPPEFILLQDAKTRRANIMTAYIGETLRDRQLTIGELTKAISALKKFSTD